MNIEEIDILRGGKRHDLLSKTRQARLLQRIKEGAFVLVAASPPCGTFSRARHANRRGPRPVRSKAYPRGFPWLEGAARRNTTSATALVDFAARALRMQHATRPGLTVLEHPEDLGRVGPDVPGSIWQFTNIQSLKDEEGVVTGAIRQSDFGTGYQKPTRLLGRLPGLGQRMALGWPGQVLGPPHQVRRRLRPPHRPGGRGLQDHEYLCMATPALRLAGTAYGRCGPSIAHLHAG